MNIFVNVFGAVTFIIALFITSTLGFNPSWEFIVIWAPICAIPAFWWHKLNTKDNEKSKKEFRNGFFWYLFSLILTGLAGLTLTDIPKATVWGWSTALLFLNGMFAMGVIRQHADIHTMLFGGGVIGQLKDFKHQQRKFIVVSLYLGLFGFMPVMMLIMFLEGRFDS